MNYKKTICIGALSVAILALHLRLASNCMDYRMYNLRRKANCLNRKINRVLRKMDSEHLKKYKEELLEDYRKIKEKIDNLTIKDIKDAGNELFDNILDSIEQVKEKLITYSK